MFQPSQKADRDPTDKGARFTSFLGEEDQVGDSSAGGVLFSPRIDGNSTDGFGFSEATKASFRTPQVLLQSAPKP